MANNILSALVLPLHQSSTERGLYIQAASSKSDYVSYPDLHKKIVEAMRQFRAAGIKQGDKVVLPFSTSFASISAFFALIGIGALPLSIKTPAYGGNREEFDSYLREFTRRFGARAVFCEFEVTTWDGGAPQLTIDHGSMAVDSNDPAWHAPAAEDVAFVQFSSGTTGKKRECPFAMASSYSSSN